jgi:PadR family transcriptional regulator PadR
LESKEFQMSSNRLAFAALGMACIASAAGGGYLATRQNTVPTPAAAMSPAVTATPTAAPVAPVPTPAVPERSVQETEAVVAGAAKTSTVAPKPAAAKRVESQGSAPRPATTAGAASARRDQPPPLASTWPSSAASQPPAAPPMPAPIDPVPSGSVAPRVDEPARAAQDPPRAPEPPQKTFEDLVIARDSVIGLQTETRVSSETARVEDRVDARVTRDVRVGDRVAVPAGARAIGSVSLVERGGKFKERARLGIRFHTLVLADGTRVPINTETIFRDGDAPTNSRARKLGDGVMGGPIPHPAISYPATSHPPITTSQPGTPSDWLSSYLVTQGMPLDTWQEQLRRGSLDLAILLAVASGPRYGLAIIQHLEAFTDLVVTEGTIYPILGRLTKEGLLEAYWVEDEAVHPRKYYTLTRSGARRLTEMKAQWRAFVVKIERLMAASESST